MMSTEDIQRYRAALASMIEHGSDTAEALRDMLCANVPLRDKFLVLDFCTILQRNAQSPGSLKGLLQALNILEKYGRHLLKPAASRSNMWHHIKYSNKIFRERVDTIQGGRDIMSLMGYTQFRPDGVAFPDGEVPDHDHILKLVTDILQGRKELEFFLEKQHPNPSSLEQYLSPQLITVLNGDTDGEYMKMAAGSQQKIQDVVPSLTPTSAPYQNLPGISGQTGTSEVSGLRQHPGPSMPIDSHYTEPNLLPHADFPQQYPTIYQAAQMGSNYSQQVYPHTMVPKQNVGVYQQGRGQTAGSDIQGQDQHMITSPYQEMQLQQNQGHQMRLDVEKTNEMQYNDMETKTPSIACDICGENHARVICKQCDNKQLCKDCDIKWHKHPKRQNHILEQMRPSAADIAQMAQPRQNIDMRHPGAGRADAMPMYTMQRVPSPASHVDYSLPPTAHGQQMNQTQGSHQTSSHDRSHNIVSYSTMDHTANIAPPSPAHSEPLNAHMPSTFIYSQPSMMGHMPATMHYPSGMIQQGHVPYGMSNPMLPGHLAQYPVSYFPNMYMPQQPPQQPPPVSLQGYLTPAVSSNVGAQRSDRLPATLPRSSSAQSTSVTPVVVQNVRQSISSPKISEPSEILSMGTSSASFTSSVSELLPGIMAITDIEKRQTRLQINIMTLKDDLQDWEEKINAIILQNPNFFQDDEYINLSRKKRRHLQEISELLKYRKEMEKLVADKVERDLEQREEAKIREMEVETLKERFNQIKIGSHDQHAGSTPGIPDQPVTVFQNYVTAASHQGIGQQVAASTSSGLASTLSGRVAAGPVTTTYRPQKLENQSQFQPDKLSAEDTCPTLKLGSFDEHLPEDVQRMLVLDQNPFEPRPALDENTKNEHKAVSRAAAAEHVLFPPNVQAGIQDVANEVNIGLKKGNSDPNLKQGQVGQEKISINKSQSSSDLHKWQCEHCTFLNDYSTKACIICFKTSDNPKRIVPNMPAVSEANPIGGHLAKPCEDCTFVNELGAKTCHMCGKSRVSNEVKEPNVNEQIGGNQGHKQVVRNQAIGQREVLGNQAFRPKQEVGNQAARPKQVVGNQAVGQERVGNKSVSEAAKDTSCNAAAAAAATTSVGRLIEEEQDQVYLEKKAAHQRFEKMNRSAGEGDFSQTTAAQQEAAIKNPEVPKETMESSQPALQQQVVQEWVVVEKTSPGEQSTLEKPSQSESGLTPADPQLTPSNKDIERLRKHSGHELSSGSSSSYKSAASNLEDTSEPKVNITDQPGQGKVAKPPQLNFAVAIEQINQKREQEQMSLDGHEFMSTLKAAERLGYDIPEVQIAMTYSIKDNMQPLDWLKSKWADLVDIVVTMATERGNVADENDIGDMSVQEAKRALIECSGEIDVAVDMCARERKAKYADVSSCGEYAREEVLTALYQNHGDVEESIDQLNHSVIQNFADRLWETNENRGGDAVIAEAARSAELSNSVSNSVISHTGFQRLISDTHINRERRVRLVLVEGKLKSWGRAETVVTIMEQEVTSSAHPLECTLEDIIEAVRNCGDRRSSLVYLTQECGVCYSLFPMTKMRDIGACNCKLCQFCVKQYFEVAIREHYVRDWGCPLCEAPELEDEATAANYFDFLSLILQNLVSRDVMELYEVKLRDWHLQKDPSFRWCAHCASGFIWDRPDILGMTCPSCHQKTCFMCKIKWEEQHEGLTCEEFEQWKINNDPEKQAKGVKLYLEENGIDCPSCKMRYSLAKGGCMHFKCPQCGYEFCSGCSQAFLHQEACRVLKSCNGKGLHCHHPRDCFYYLRDSDTPELQKLLKNQRVLYNTDAPPTQDDRNHCPVMEQKEYGAQKKDEPCAKNTKKGMAGLCEDHYKEYLVGLINKNKIDPLMMMSLQQMKIFIERNEKEMPKLNQNEPEQSYRKRVTQFIKERWQLHR